MQHRIEFLLFQIIRAIVLSLPLKSAQKLGAFLGTLAFSIVKTRRLIALDNLRYAFPEKSEAERSQIVKGAFRNYCIALVEFLWFPNLNDEILRKLMKMQNPEVMVQAHQRGKGMVMLAGHFGNWELIALGVARQSGLPVSIIVQTQSNRYVDAVINRHRCMFGSKVVPMGMSVREIVRALHNGGVVAMAPDQSGPMEGPYVDFFGRYTSTHQGPAVFALKTGAPLQIGFIIRQQDWTYRVVFEEIQTSDISEYNEEHVVELTRRHTALLEKYIRLYPDHWLWMHRRWKHTSDRIQQEKSAIAQA